LSDARHPLTSTDLVVLGVRDGVVTMSLFVDDWN
jgi:hypothetical protein